MAVFSVTTTLERQLSDGSSDQLIGILSERFASTAILILSAAVFIYG